jgi:hypothetical protein
MDALVDVRCNQQARDVRQHELPEKEEKQVFHVVVGRSHDVIENENEKEDKAAKKGHPDGGHQLIKSRFAINLVVITEKGMEKNPVERVKRQTEPEFGIGTHSRQNRGKIRRFTNMLTVHVEPHPGNEGGQQIEKQVNTGQFGFVHKRYAVRM